MKQSNKLHLTSFDLPPLIPALDSIDISHAVDTFRPVTYDARDLPVKIPVIKNSGSFKRFIKTDRSKGNRCFSAPAILNNSQTSILMYDAKPLPEIKFQYPTITEKNNSVCSISTNSILSRESLNYEILNDSLKSSTVTSFEDSLFSHETDSSVESKPLPKIRNKNNVCLDSPKTYMESRFPMSIQPRSISEITKSVNKQDLRFGSEFQEHYSSRFREKLRKFTIKLKVKHKKLPLIPKYTS